MRKITNKEFRFFNQKKRKLSNFLFLLLFLFSGGLSIAQINYQQNWNTVTNLGGWDGGWGSTSTLPCEGPNSIRRNLWGSATSSSVRTPNIGPSNGGIVTITYEYKVIDYDWQMPTVPTPGGDFTLYWEWSTSTTGPWTEFAQVGGANHIVSMSCATKTHTATIPEVYSDEFYIRARGVRHSGDFFMYIDNVSITQAASSLCIPPTGVTSSNITKNSATVSWNTDIFEATATFPWELRTSGNAGSGAAGLVQSGTATGTSTVNFTGLSPATEYQFYIRTNCTATNQSIWVPVPHIFTTMCNYPEVLTTTVGTICGYGTTNLAATAEAGGTLYWFENPNAEYVHTGATFDTPTLEENTTYYVKAGAIAPGANVQVGNGTAISTAQGQNPFYHSWGGYKHQYIYTAEELLAANIAPGPINSVGFQVVTGSSVARNNFTIHIGSTTQATATSSHVQGLTQVYSNPAQSVTAGDNIYQFDAPFVWDGTSNIVVQVNWSNENYGNFGASGTTLYHTAPTTQTTVTFADQRTAQQLLETVTGGVINAAGQSSGNTSTSAFRPNTLFNATALCFSPATEVEVTISTPPTVALSATTIDACQGSDSELVTVTVGLEDYDEFEWIPNTGVSGNKDTGWIFNLQDSQTYSLVASQSNGACAKRLDFEVNVIKLGYQDLEEEYTVCVDDVVKLSILKENPVDNLLPGQTVFTTGFENGITGLSLEGTGGTITEITNLTTEGQSAIRWTHGFNANSTLTIDQTFDFSDAEGLQITFDNIAILEATQPTFNWDYGRLQYSLDGGESWSDFLPAHYFGGSTALTQNVRFARFTYPAWGGLTTAGDNNDLWRSEKLILPRPTGNAFDNVKIRFVLKSDGITNVDAWYLDNIKVSKMVPTTKVWSPVDKLYLDEAKTQPYNGESVGEVYFSSAVSGEIPVTVTISDSGNLCETIVETTVVVPNITFPGLDTEAYCTTTSVDDLDFQRSPGVTYEWYATMASQTPITEIAANGTYFVKLISESCESGKQPVDIIIVGGVNVTVNNNQEFCEGATVANLSVNSFTPGATVQWFDSETSTTPLASTATLPIGTNTYYVNQVLHGCQSTKIPVQVTVYEMPTPLTQSEVAVCYNTTVGTAVLDGTNNLRWYTSETAANPLGANIVLTNAVYYVEKINGVCETERMPVQVSILSELNGFQENVIDICGPGQVGDLEEHVSGVATGAVVKWYSTSNGTTPLADTTPLANGVYYGEQQLDDCVSNRKAIVVRVNSSVAPVIAPQSVCQNTRIEDIVLPTTTGISYQWFATPATDVALAPSTALVSQTYYVRRLQNGCLSDAALVSVSVIPTPSAPTGVSPQDLEEGSTIADIVMEQGSIEWYITEEDAHTGTNPLMPNMPIVDGTVYYAVIVTPQGCRSLPTPIAVNVTVGINDLDVANLKLYPNPTDSVINISYKETIDSIEVYSMTGQRLMVQDTISNNVTVDMTELPAGTYMVKISVGQNSQIIKVVRK